MAISERTFYLICGALLLIGGVAFIWGGSSHPPTDARLGVVGSEEFFRNFVSHVVQHGNWESIHTGILVGPHLWALGGIGACLMLRQHGEGCFCVLGTVALAMGATAWAVTFVFDGFVALRLAQAIAHPSGDVTALLTAFQANQVVVIRLGLVSWILVGLGIAAVGASIVSATPRRRAVEQVVGVTGILLGAWPMAAWATGIFDPGPFISRWWPLTALLTTGWFMAMGVMVFAHATSKAETRGTR